MNTAGLLAAAISLAPDTAVAVHSLVPDTGSISPPDVLHSARRHLVSSRQIQDALLPSVQLGHRPALYVFSIVPAVRMQATVSAMDALRFDGLVAPSTASYFPFQKIYEQPRHILSHFLSAVRTRLIDNIVSSGSGVQRCKDGFLISHQQLTPETDWGAGWEYKALSRPLIFCHIQLQPTSSAILIRPTLLPTPYLPLPSCLPLLPRSPILLLPYGTPAYFLTTYSGPTSVLVRQFTDALQGHGQPPLDSSFIIGWISVENRRGEDKGITFIYPTRLCLAFVPALNRSLLDYTPDLPGPLQPSPKLLSASTPLSECPPITYPYRPSLLGSPTTELKAFRTLTLSKSKNIRTVAAQVSSYVDHVAKDRERERERLKREREGGTAHSPSLLARTTPSTSSNPQNAAPPPPLAVHTPTPTTTAAMPTQNFYPSPPQADTTAVPIPGNTSPVLPVAPQPPVTQTPAPSTTQVQAPPLTASSSSSYDPFGYLGMNMVDMDMDFGMDMGMNFGMGMGMNLGGNSGTTSAGPANRSTYSDGASREMGLGGSSGMDFEDFTDDDFNFFDQPSTHAPAPPPPPPPPQHQPTTSGISAIPNSLQVTSPPLFGDVHLSGPGPPHPTPHSQPTPASHGGPWSSNFPEGFTPRSVEHMDSVIPPELATASPSATPLINNNNVDGACPLTPNVHLDPHPHSLQPPPDITVLDDSRKIFNFDPIPFSKYHRVCDGKYAPAGKFGLPIVNYNKKPAENTTGTTSWKPRYDAITDPRVGVMRKLIGVKRKLTVQGGRTGKDVRTSPWTTEHEEWKVHRSAGDPKDIDSEPSEDEMSQSEDGVSEEEETPATSRPSTPPPSYLPLGPTLIHTQFHHTYLLPLSKPLRPPGSSISGPGAHGGLAVTPMPIANVPTPVSPAAGLGLTAEKWRALEVVINVLAKEAVENVVWRDTWTTSNAFGLSNKALVTEGKKLTEIWVSDIKFVERVFGNLEGVQTGLTVNDVFGLDSPAIPSTRSQALQVLTSPKVSVGKGEAIVTVLPPALRFWEKLGLGPKNGEKDGTVYVLFADDGEQRRAAEVANWLTGVCTVYETKHLGKLSPGTSTYCVKDGLVPLRFDLSFRKLFATFATGLSTVSTPIVLFLVVPITFMSLSSSVFRQILSTMQKALKTLPENRVIVQLIPEHTINHIESDPASTNQLESFCINLYNRILVPVAQPLARIFSPDNTPIPVKSYLQKPIFTLARPIYNKVTYTRSVHASLDVLDRYTLLHVGYRVSSCGKWVMAACVDQRGEAWDQAVWLVKTDQQDSDGEASAGGSHEESFAAKKVWEFVTGFAKRADVEWRIVISKLGIMDEAELTAWTTFLSTVIPTSGPGSVHVSLICADPDSSWLFTKLSPDLPHHQPGTNTSKSPPPKHSIFSDASSMTYALFPTTVLPIATPPTQSDLGLIPHPVGLVPRSTTCLVRVPRSAPLTSISMLHIHVLSTRCSPPLLAKKTSAVELKTIHADVTKNFYELSVLAHSRWKISAPEPGSSTGSTSSSNLGLGIGSRTGVNPILPIHLAMVDIMGQVTDGADGVEIDS
ncbi:Mediator of RNA polymerase II transcription subunit 13 [Leucoagaricus sp. SymC.cos]|nr:Mediator of RNA polymerase II transcription subunit 13 [Leucoagaricus sp. SymC.cos]